MHGNVPLKTVSLSHVKIFNFTSQMVYHSIEKNVRVVTILYDIKKKLTPCPRGLLLWGTSCIFRFSNLLHLFKQQQKSTY